MNTLPLGAAQLALRLTFGAVVGYAAILHTTSSTASASGYHVAAPTPSTPVVLHALMAVIAIWLIFGVRTRVVALLGALCYAAVWWIERHEGTSGFVDLLVPVHVVLLLALPLVLLGGGRFSLYRAGWRNPF